MREFQDLAESTFPEWPTRELSKQMRVSRTWQKLKQVWQEWFWLWIASNARKKGLIEEKPQWKWVLGKLANQPGRGLHCFWPKVAMLPAFIFLSSKNPSSNWNESRTLTKTEVRGSWSPTSPSSTDFGSDAKPSLELERWSSPEPTPLAPVTMYSDIC